MRLKLSQSQYIHVLNCQKQNISCEYSYTLTCIPIHILPHPHTHDCVLFTCTHAQAYTQILCFKAEGSLRVKVPRVEPEGAGLS